MMNLGVIKSVVDIMIKGDVEEHNYTFTVSKDDFNNIVNEKEVQEQCKYIKPENCVIVGHSNLKDIGDNQCLIYNYRGQDVLIILKEE